MHHLVFPIPLPRPSPISHSQLPSSTSIITSGPDLETDDPPQGINLAHRLQVAGLLKEFNGLAHVFVSCLGPMAYATADVDGDLEKASAKWGGGDMTTVQCEFSRSDAGQSNERAG